MTLLQQAILNILAAKTARLWGPLPDNPFDVEQWFPLEATDAVETP